MTTPIASWARRTQLLAVATTVAASTSACMEGPTNGQTFTGSTIGQTVTASGLHTTPNAEVDVQVLGDPSLDPTNDTNWITIGTTYSSTTGEDINDPTSLAYPWQIGVVPVPNAEVIARWPQGGLARIRAITPSANGTEYLLTFNSNVQNCFISRYSAGASWITIGQDCMTPYTVHEDSGAGPSLAPLIVSTSPTPADETPTPPFLTYPTGTQTDGPPSAAVESQTAAYYQSIGAPTSLAAFRGLYGMGTTNPETIAVYYNQNDLGLGREMHCAKNGAGLACYVVNYGTLPDGVTPNFGGDPSIALSQAIARQDPIAVVAMVSSGPNVEVANGIKFIVYKGDGSALQNFARLDTAGVNEAVPQNCVSCHAGSHGYDAVHLRVMGAHFLPFDQGTFSFSTQAGYTSADEQDSIRTLNEYVSLAGPTPAIQDLIQGWYGGNVATPGTAFNASYVPSGWAGSTGASALYTQAIQPYCRTCHSSHDDYTSWLTAADLTLDQTILPSYVCDVHVMPHAEQTARLFWASPARAYIENAFGFYGPCAP